MKTWMILTLLLITASAPAQPVFITFYSSVVLTDSCANGGPDPDSPPLPDETQLFVFMDYDCNGPSLGDDGVPFLCPLTNGSFPPEGCLWVTFNPPATCGYLGIYCAEAQILQYNSEGFPLSGQQEIVLSNWQCHSCSPPTLPVPTGLTCYPTGADILLQWDFGDNLHYRIYSSSVPDGPFDTLEGSTDNTFFTITAPPDNVRMYVVVGWDGQ